MQIDDTYLDTKIKAEANDIDKYGFLRVVGLALTKDGVDVMEKLVGPSDHDHLVWLALFSFRLSFNIK